jgi:hypothetical protein
MLISNYEILYTSDKRGFYNNEKEKLETYFKKMRNNIVKVKYNSIIEYGRVFPEKSLSLSSMKRKIRRL